MVQQVLAVMPVLPVSHMNTMLDKHGAVSPSQVQSQTQKAKVYKALHAEDMGRGDMKEEGTGIEKVEEGRLKEGAR